MEAGERDPEPILVCLVERYAPTGTGERSAETNDVRHSALLYNDLHDFGRLEQIAGEAQSNAR